MTAKLQNELDFKRFIEFYWLLVNKLWSLEATILESNHLIKHKTISQLIKQLGQNTNWWEEEMRVTPFRSTENDEIE